MILEYIKTSIDILMNMKMEDAQARRKQKKHDDDDAESVLSNNEIEVAHSDYEKMLQKYEASVRNHIKIE